MAFWQRNKEVDELKKENEQLKAFLKTDREEKCEAYLNQNPEGSILGLVKKYPMVGNDILEQHYKKGELAKSFVNGSGEHYKLTTMKETTGRKITGNLGSPQTTLLVNTTQRAIQAEPIFRSISRKKRKSKWSDEIKSKTLRLRSEGIRYAEISKITGVPRGSISKIVLHAVAVKVIPIKKGKPKWASEKKEVIRLRREGKSYFEISKLTGVTKGSISSLIPKSEKGYKNHKKVPLLELSAREKMVLNSIKLKDRQTPQELGQTTGYGTVDIERNVYTLRKKGYPIQTIWKPTADGRQGRTGVYTLGETTDTTPKTITGKQPPWEQVSDPTLADKTIEEVSKATGLTKVQIYNARWKAKQRGKITTVERPTPKWKIVGKLVEKGLDNKQISEALRLTNRQVSDARWNAKKEGMNIPSRYTKVEVGATTPTTSTTPEKPKEESDYMKKARAEDKIDLKELCEKVGVDFYHYCDARRKIGFKSPYEYLLTKMLLSKSIRDNEAQQFLDIALKRAELILPAGLKRSICDRAISFHKLPNIHLVMKQKVPEELESIGITFTDIEDFLSDFALKPELKLSDWKTFVRNFGELKEIDFRNSFDFLNNIIMQFFRRNQYTVKISYSSYDKCFFLRKWRRTKSVI